MFASTFRLYPFIDRLSALTHDPIAEIARPHLRHYCLALDAFRVPFGLYQGPPVQIGVESSRHWTVCRKCDFCEEETEPAGTGDPTEVQNAKRLSILVTSSQCNATDTPF